MPAGTSVGDSPFELLPAPLPPKINLKLIHPLTPAIVCTGQKRPGTATDSGEVRVAPGGRAAAAKAGPVRNPGPRPITFLDTLAGDIREAVNLLKQATPLAQQPGWYIRLGDVGAALGLIQESGLLPHTKPDWYLRLREFAGLDEPSAGPGLEA
jgi:hypothetical protein